jgi:hypothetical protein
MGVNGMNSNPPASIIVVSGDGVMWRQEKKLFLSDIVCLSTVLVKLVKSVGTTQNKKVKKTTTVNRQQ